MINSDFKVFSTNLRYTTSCSFGAPQAKTTIWRYWATQNIITDPPKRWENNKYKMGLASGTIIYFLNPFK